MVALTDTLVFILLRQELSLSCNSLTFYNQYLSVVNVWTIKAGTMTLCGPRWWAEVKRCLSTPTQVTEIPHGQTSKSLQTTKERLSCMTHSIAKFNEGVWLFDHPPAQVCFFPACQQTDSVFCLTHFMSLTFPATSLSNVHRLQILVLWCQVASFRDYLPHMFLSVDFLETSKSTYCYLLSLDQKNTWYWKSLVGEGSLTRIGYFWSDRIHEGSVYFFQFWVNNY